MSGDFPKKILALVAPGQNSVLKRLVNQLGGKHSFEFVFLETVEDATKSIRECPYGLFICEVEDKKSLALSVGVLKKNKKILKGTHIKVGSFNHLKNPNVEKGLKKVGVYDFFDIYINPKSFSFKLDFWFKTLKPLTQAAAGSDDVKSFSNDQAGEGAQRAIEVNPGAEGSGAAGGDKPSLKRKRNEVVKVGPIENENDMWLTTSDDDCKNVLRRWLVKLVGPSGNSGRWEQEVLKNNRTQTVWKFIFNDDEIKEMFVEGNGHWCFDGVKPEFDWNEKKWVFTGATPSLFFEGDSEEYDYRFKYDKGALCLADNSLFAETKKEFIEKTLEDTQTFDKDAAEAESESNVKGNHTEIDKNMKGDVSGDSQVSAHMEGQGSSGRDEGGHMKGAQKDNSDVGGHMEGANKDNGDVGGHMEGATKDNSDQGGSIGGKNEYREDAKGDMDGSTDGTDDLAPGKYSNQQNHKEAAAKGMDGKQKGSDQLGPNHYSNESLYHEDAKGGMDGDVGGADNLGKKHYSNKESTSGQEYGANGPMSGKKKSDEDQGETHYSNQASQSKEAGEDPKYENGNLIGRKIEKESSDYDGSVGAGASSSKNKNQDGVTEDYLAKHKAEKAREAAEAEASYNEDIAYNKEAKAGDKENQFDFGADKKWGKNKREDKMADMEDILSEKKYKESDSSYTEDEEQRAEYHSKKRGYDFETGEGASPTDAINDEFDPAAANESSAPVEYFGPSEDEFKEMIAQSEIKIFVEHKDDETTKRMATFEDMYEPELVLGIPKGVVKTEDQVNIYMLIKYLDQKVSMTIAGKVIEVEESDETNELIVVEVDNFNDERLKQFMDIYQQRQENIQKFMGLAKGVA